MHYVGWPRAWDETFTETDMRHRARPLRITGAMAPTGPLCRAPKKGADRGITCKVEDEGTLPVLKGRPTADALYVFDSSIDFGFLGESLAGLSSCYVWFLLCVMCSLQSRAVPVEKLRDEA